MLHTKYKHAPWGVQVHRMGEYIALCGKYMVYCWGVQVSLHIEYKLYCRRSTCCTTQAVQLCRSVGVQVVMCKECVEDVFTRSTSSTTWSTLAGNVQVCYLVKHKFVIFGSTSYVKNSDAFRGQHDAFRGFCLGFTTGLYCLFLVL